MAAKKLHIEKPLSDQEIINELLSIEAYASTLKQKCYILRKKLAVSTPALPKGALSMDQKNTLVAGFTKSLIKKQKV